LLPEEIPETRLPGLPDFDQMMKETKPEALIVTTVDATHDHFIIKGMEYGADIITEKPLTTDEPSASHPGCREEIW
jgi:predicted dehydrogenase